MGLLDFVLRCVKLFMMWCGADSRHLGSSIWRYLHFLQSISCSFEVVVKALSYELLIESPTVTQSFSFVLSRFLVLLLLSASVSCS